MALYGLENFVWGNVSGAFTSGQLTLNMATSHTARFTIFPARALLWNVEEYSNPAEAYWAGEAEIIEITSKSGDALDAILRGQDGTSAISSDGSQVYRVQTTPTRDQWLKVFRAPPDASGPFEAVLAGTAASVSDALARLVKDVSGEDAVVSIQGSDTASDKTSLWLGDVTTPGDVKLERLQAATRTLSLIFNSLNLITAEDSGAIAFNKSSSSESEPSVEFGAKVGFENLLGVQSSDATISGGSLTVVDVITNVSGEGAAADTLTDITADHPFGKESLIFLRYDGEAITITQTGNITLSTDDDFILNSSTRLIGFLWDAGASEWQEICRIPDPGASDAPTFTRVNQPFQGINSSTSTTIDWADGNHVLLDMDTDITTLTLSNPRDGEHYFIRIIQDGTGSHSISWPSSIKWKSGSAPAAGEANQIDAVAMVYSSTYSDYLADVATNFS